MRIFNRRHFILSSAFSISCLLNLPFNLKKSTFLYKWRGELLLPNQLSWLQFQAIQSEMMDLPLINSIEDSFIKSGKVLKVYTKFFGNKVEWNYFFKSEDAYLEWAALTTKGLRNSMYSNYPYKTLFETVPFESVPWEYPKEILITPKV